MILTHLLVPPCCIRPSAVSGPGTNEDDLTMQLQNILTYDRAIRSELEKGNTMASAPSTLLLIVPRCLESDVMDKWDYLQHQVALYINSDAPGLNSEMSAKTKKPTRGLCQRLKGKQGRFRVRCFFAVHITLFH